MAAHKHILEDICQAVWTLSDMLSGIHGRLNNISTTRNSISLINSHLTSVGEALFKV